MPESESQGRLQEGCRAAFIGKARGNGQMPWQVLEQNARPSGGGLYLGPCSQWASSPGAGAVGAQAASCRKGAAVRTLGRG